MAIADEIIRKNLDIRFQVMARPTSAFTPAVLTRLRRSGCVWISWGMESGSQRLLDLSGKGTHVANAKQVIEHTATAGISNLLMMLFGLPTSTDGDLDQTLAFMGDVYDDVDAFTSSSFVLFDGTAFARKAAELGLIVRGRRPLIQVDGMTIHDYRLSFGERAENGPSRPPRGPMEIAAWNQRRRWLGDPQIYESLVAEHYLLYAAARRTFLGGSKPGPKTVSPSRRRRAG